MISYILTNGYLRIIIRLNTIKFGSNNTLQSPVNNSFAKWLIVIKIKIKKCLNVRQKLGTRTLYFSLTRSLTPLSCEFRTHRAGSQLKNVWMSDKSWEPSSLSHSPTVSLSHSISFYMLNNFCFHGYAQKSLSYSFAFTTFATFTTFTTFNVSLSLSQHAEQLLFSCLCSKLSVKTENCNEVFWITSSPYALTLEFKELVPS